MSIEHLCLQEVCRIIRHDWVSKILIASAGGAAFYLATFQTTTLVLFPVFLMLFGGYMEYRLQKKKEDDYTPSTNENYIIMYHGAIGLCGILLTSWAVSYVQIPSQLLSISPLSPLAGVSNVLGINVDALLYSVLMAVGEEQFFRGFITDGLLSQKIPGVSNNPYFALVLSAAVFMAYHWARYGTDLNALIYVFCGGFILSWIAYKSRRLSPAMVAHVAANAIAVLGGI